MGHLAPEPPKPISSMSFYPPFKPQKAFFGFKMALPVEDENQKILLKAFRVLGGPNADSLGLRNPPKGPTCPSQLTTPPLLTMPLVLR